MNYKPLVITNYMENDGIFSKLFKLMTEIRNSNMEFSNIIRIKTEENSENIYNIFSEIRKSLFNILNNDFIIISIFFGTSKNEMNEIKFSLDNNIPLISFKNDIFFKSSNNDDDDEIFDGDDFFKALDKKNLFSKYPFEKCFERENFEKNIIRSIFKSYDKQQDNFNFLPFYLNSDYSGTLKLEREFINNFKEKEIELANLMISFMEEDKDDKLEIYFKYIKNFKDEIMDKQLLEMYKNFLSNDKVQDIFFPKMDKMKNKIKDIQDIKQFYIHLEKGFKDIDNIFSNLHSMINESSSVLSKIFILCIIFNLEKTAKVCWKYLENPIRYSLLAVKVYKYYSEKAENLYILDISLMYTNLSNEWEMRAVKNITNCFSIDRDKTDKVLIHDITSDTEQKWSESILSVAYSTDARIFLNARPCQEKLTKIWFQNIPNKMSLIIILQIYFNIFVACLCKEYRKSIWEFYKIPVSKFFINLVRF